MNPNCPTKMRIVTFWRFAFVFAMVVIIAGCGSTPATHGAACTCPVKPGCSGPPPPCPTHIQVSPSPYSVSLEQPGVGAHN